MKRLISSLLFTILVLYGVVCLFAWLFAERMIFQPPPASYEDGSRIIKILVDNEEISAVHLTSPDARYTILFSHGNAVDLGRLYPILREIQSMGFSVLAYDYRGYGTSKGVASEHHAYRDIDAAYRYLRKELGIPADSIIAHGQSLGGGVAADLASREPLGGLILESTFTTAYRVMTRMPLLPFDQFKTLDKLEKIECPVLVIHGRNDGVISFRHGEKLFEKARQPKQKLWVDGAGHNNLLEAAGGEYERALQHFSRMIDNL